MKSQSLEINNYIMKKHLFITSFAFLCLVFLSSCSYTNNDEEKKIKYSDFYGLKVIDTLDIAVISRYGIRLIDYNKENNNLLFSNAFNMDTIYEANEKGNIVNKFSAAGEHDKAIGSDIYGIGYFNDTSIVVTGTRGVFFYKPYGALVRTISDLTPLGYGGLSLRIREINNNKGSFILSNFKPSIKVEEIRNLRGTMKLYETVKYLTLYNLKNNTYEVKIGFEKHSIFRKEDNEYFNTDQLFDYDNHKGYVYSLINPESKIYAYDVNNNFQLVKSIDLMPEYFKIPHFLKLGEKPKNSFRHVYVNSSFGSLNVWENNCIITYSTGIPDDKFAEGLSNVELQELWKSYQKYYAIYLKDDIKQCKDIPLPKGAGSIALFKSMNEIYLTTIPTEETETKGITRYYVCKLEKEIQ
jgi:hypothetical protein